MIPGPTVPAEVLARERRERAARECWLCGLAKTAERPWRMAATGTALAGWLLVPQAWALATILDAVLAHGRAPATLTGAFALLATCLGARAVLSKIAQDAAGDVAEAARRELRGRLWAALQAHGPRWLRDHRSGSLGELLLGHAEAAGGYHAGYRLARAEVAWVPPVLLLAVFASDPVPGLLLLFAAPLVPLFMVLVGWGAEAASREQLGELARMGGHFADRLKGLGLIRLYGRGEAELAGIAAAAESLRLRSMRVLRIAFLSSGVLEFFASISVALVALYFGLGYLGMLGLEVAPDLRSGLFCLLLAPEFFAPLRRLGAHYHDRAAALAAAAEIESALGHLPAPHGQDHGVGTGAAAVPASAAAAIRWAAPPVAGGPQEAADQPAVGPGADPGDDAHGGSLRRRPSADAQAGSQPAMRPGGGFVVAPLSGVNRRSPLLQVRSLALAPAVDAPLLFQDLSFDLHPGARLALAGPSGCGKSALLEAVAGWITPRGGAIEISAGARVGHAGQRPYLFQGSLADNLRLAGAASDVALHAAAGTAQVLRFARHLPQGLDTPVGERGFGLSGGEARRVALARALLRQPQLLLLDEPTAFLDPDTEAALLQALSAHAPGCAILVATHSPRVMRWAGQVLELPAGRVRPAGAAP